MTDLATSLFIRPPTHRTRSLLILTLALSSAAKFLGFVRVQQIAALLGASIYADALLLAFQLIWLMETVVVAAAVGPSLLSFVYKIEIDRGPDEAAHFFLHAALWSSVLSGTYGLVLWVFNDVIVSTVAPGFGDEARRLMRDLLVISAIAPLCLTLSEFSGMVNRLLHNGVWYSVPQLVANSTALGGLLIGFHLGGQETAAKGMMVGLTIGAVAVILLQLAVIPKDAARSLWRYFAHRPTRPFMSTDGRRLWGAVVALAFAAAVSELYIYVDFFLASHVQAGGIGLISYASRLAQLTNMLLISSAFVVLEPRWARALAEQGDEAWRRLIALDAVALISLLAAPVVALNVFAPQVTSLIYPGGAMDARASAELHSLTRIYGLSIVGMSVSLVLARMLMLRGQTRWIVAISIGVLPVKVVLSTVLASRLGLNGLAWATVSGLVLQALGYGAVLWHAKLGVGLPALLNFAIRLVATFLFMFLSAWAISTMDFTGAWLTVVVCGVLAMLNIGMGVTLGFAYADSVKALLSPARWRQRLEKLMGRV